MPEPEMRETCTAFLEAQATAPHLKKCPESEVQLIRRLGGHGGRSCEPCKKQNRNEQRKRENAKKRERRAKRKRDRMTAGIGAGNVTWTAPNTWTPSVVVAPILASYPPHPQRLNSSKENSMTQALQYGVSGSISQDEHGVYFQSCQGFATTMSDAVQPAQNGSDMLATEILDHPNIPNDARWGQNHTETCSLNEWTIRMGLNERNPAFEDSDSSGTAKEFCSAHLLWS